MSQYSFKKKSDTTHIPCNHQQEERTLTIHLHHEYGAPPLVHPCPPTKPLGKIKQNRHVLPTPTPFSTSAYLGVFVFGQAMEWWLCFRGCIFWAKLGLWGDCIPWRNCGGRAEFDRLSRSKKSTIPQSTVGCLVGEQIGCGMERRLCL